MSYFVFSQSSFIQLIKSCWEKQKANKDKWLSCMNEQHIFISYKVYLYCKQYIIF